MGLSRALNTGVSGLVNHQKALDNVGNNLANVNTVGFKKGVYQFQTLLEQTLSSAMAADNGRGSVNAITVGLGTQTGSINKVFSQGALETTGSANDMAIYGNGFFVLSTGNGGYAYTRDGSFKLDADGYLSSGNGYYVQGTLAVKNSDGSHSIPQDAKPQNINIPIGSTGGMSQTSKVAFTGNLNSTQSVSSGLQLFGSNAPTVNDLQQWMSSDFNSTDTTWTALEEGSYVTVEQSGLSNVSSVYYYLDGNTVKHVGELNGTGEAMAVDELEGLGYVPMIRTVETINGGNVQTSVAFGVKIPEAGADGLFAQWVYDSFGGSYENAVLSLTDPSITQEDIWPEGSAFWSDGVAYPPQSGETYAATLDTPLEQVMYYQGGKWTQPFANIKDGDQITVSFDKGQSKVEATFTYNVPSSTATIAGQTNVDNQQSYTLEHFLIFLAGDVDNTGTACAAITPDMFDTTAAYQEALADVDLAKSSGNTDATGGVMGLVDVAAQISAANGGADDYDAPMETAGAFTREGASDVAYTRYVNGELTTVSGSGYDSFNVSIVSNLGADNAISNLNFTYNGVTHKTMFSAESEYSSAQGGSASATVTYYDSLGNPKTATLRLALVSEENDYSVWRWYADSADDSDFGWVTDETTGEIISNLNIGTGLIRFDSDGNYIPGSDYSETGGIVINLNDQGVDNPIQVKIENGLDSSLTQDLDFSALTYSATSNSLTLESQNGYPPGSLESYTVAADGTIYGVYSTGVVSPIARLIIATVPNETGLVSTGDNLFYVSPSSGEAQYGYPTLGGRGEIRQYQLETSNVDLSEEFTKLIAIERGFQANSRVITTADEMLQELLNLKR